jgi:hypothetical protein
MTTNRTFLTASKILPSSLWICICAGICLARAASAEEMLTVSFGMREQGGGVRGVGVLAWFPAPGPQHCTVVREDAPAVGAPLLVRVCDPTGALVAWREWPRDQSNELVVPVRKGAAGLWRLSISGGTGRASERERFTVSLPRPEAWGLRGEMALGFFAPMPRASWLWVPPVSSEILFEATGGRVAVDGKTLDPASRKGQVCRWQPPAAGGVVEVVVDKSVFALAIDGIPALLCPSRNDAERLQGGSTTVAHRLMAGPLQARARAWMVEAVRGDLKVVPAGVPIKVDDPLATVQLYGKYGPLSSLLSACKAQIIDPDEKFFGALRPAQGFSDADSLHGGIRSPFDAGGLATAVVSALDGNSVRGDPALIRRATLAAFHHFADMQDGDLIRELDLAATSYPIRHAFFAYEGALARPYHLLKDLLDPTAKALWREGLLAVGDRLADHRAFQTNQWWHVLLGHLYCYMGTGEERFRTYFERGVDQLLGGPSGLPLLGQHPAGYFIENGGPDGHYDSLSMTCLAESAQYYARIPQADPQRQNRLSQAISRNAKFAALHWLPQPDGTVTGPSAPATRMQSSFAKQPWPGVMLLRDREPLALTRWLLSPKRPVSESAIEPWRINTEPWAREVLAYVQSQGLEAPFVKAVESPWTMAAIAVARPSPVQPGVLPCRGPDAVWDLPGQVAWKAGPFYGLVFYAATGLVSPPNLRVGGAPTAIWTAASGAFLLSSRPPRGAGGSEPEQDPPVHACITALLAGASWRSGSRAGILTWQEPGRIFTIAEIEPDPRIPKLAWRYRILPNGLVLSVELAGTAMTDPWLELPLSGVRGAKKIGNVVTAPGAKLKLAAGPGVELTVDRPAVPQPVQMLRVPLELQAGVWRAEVRITDDG